MSAAIDIYVLDTSAWLSRIEDAAGADLVQAILEKARTGDALVLCSCMRVMEGSSITLQERDRREAQTRVD
jgi:uncharacterized protein with PIN domain